METNLPVLTCKGTHYEVGFQIGKRFGSMIQDLLTNWKYFQTVLKIGETPSGKELIKHSLTLCRSKYPGYCNEIKGMSDGSGIQFERLFMLNIDSILDTVDEGDEEIRKIGGTGCTSILCNKDEILLGHTEDAMAEIKNHVYIISAEILSDDHGKVLEKFTTLCYAGALMGYTMGFNSHGMIYSVNTIFPDVYTNGTPRAFIARATLGARNLNHLKEILKDKGNGIADGFSVNVYFCSNEHQPLAGKETVKGDETSGGVILYNIEVAPPVPLRNNTGINDESIIDVREVLRGSGYLHCNKYLRISTNECNPTAVKYSDMRNSTIDKYCEPCCVNDIRQILSDETDFHYPIYNNGKTGDKEYEMSFIRTVAVGIFNINKKTWSVYAAPPVSNDPVRIFSID